MRPKLGAHLRPEQCDSQDRGGRRAAQHVLEPIGVDLAFFTTRERDCDEVLPWDHLDSGLDKQWLWDDWQDALTGYEQPDCRWTPCLGRRRPIRGKAL